MTKATFFNGTIIFIAGILIGFLIPSVFNSSSVQNENDHNKMHSVMEYMTSSLVGLSGDDFDQAFMKEMIVHHEGAIEMAKMVLDTSDNPKLLQLAKDIITAQDKEIDMMKMWQANGFGDLNNNTINDDSNYPVACTMDAKICPDGSAVGRIGPNCEFAKCPGEN